MRRQQDNSLFRQPDSGPGPPANVAAAGGGCSAFGTPTQLRVLIGGTSASSATLTNGGKLNRASPATISFTPFSGQTTQTISETGEAGATGIQALDNTTPIQLEIGSGLQLRDGWSMGFDFGAAISSGSALGTGRISASKKF